jgi:hypothetical protein
MVTRQGLKVLYESQCHPITGALHPPGYDNKDLISYIQSTLDSILDSSPNASIILTGDFNHFNYRHLYSSFNLKQLVKVPTRGQNILDLVLTNVHKYYNQPETLPPIGSSDHNVVLLSPKTTRPKGKKSKVLVPDTCSAKRHLFLEKLKNVNFTAVLYQPSCEQRYELFDCILNDVIDKTLPFKSVKTYSLDKPWMSTEIKRAIAERQKAWRVLGPPSSEFRSLRNKINRLVKKQNNAILRTKSCSVENLIIGGGGKK